MNTPLFYALAACALAATAEGLWMGKDGSRFMKSLKQPAYAPPGWLWAMIGVAYYAVCFAAIYRLAARRHGLAVSLVLVVMAANAGWNYVYFRRRDLRLAFWYSVGYAVLVAGSLPVLLQADALAALGFALYAAYLPYALLLFYRTWRLNT